MKKLLFVLAATLIFVSCSKDEAPAPVVLPIATKVIEKINLLSLTTNTIPERYETRFEYNANGAISKIALYRNGSFDTSYTFTYQNNIPVSAIYEDASSGDAPSVINFNYTNDIYYSTYYTMYNTTNIFNYNAQTNLFTSYDTTIKFMLNSNDDLAKKVRYATIANFNFDSSKKGPLYSVKNKKWIAALWYTSAVEQVYSNVITAFPVSGVTLDNTVIPYTNTYDSDGYVTKSTSSANNGNNTNEIDYTYKSL